MEAKLLFPTLSIILLCFSPIITAAPLLADVENKCVYTVYVRTSKTINAGTDSIISLELYDSSGDGLRINNLETWGGIMGEGHDYYERGNLDIFTGRGPCLEGPVCSMKLISDGSGAHHGWYCNYVEVTTTGPHIPCHQELFTVEQWLARDRSPHKLTAERDNCDSTSTSTSTTAVGHAHDLLPIDVAPQVAFS